MLNSHVVMCYNWAKKVWNKLLTHAFAKNDLMVIYCVWCPVFLLYALATITIEQGCQCRFNMYWVSFCEQQRYILSFYLLGDCYEDDGRYYNGTINVTKAGNSCMPWTADFPHKHDRSPAVFPELRNSHNFCRNPGGEEKSPWCYTSDRNVRWQHCDIPSCGT